MSKRKHTMSTRSSKKKKRHCRVLKLKNAPPVNSIQDLIKISHTLLFYKNINTLMLRRISPFLEQLNNLIGMQELKESVFYQVIYYLKGMHTKNQNEEYLHTMILGSPGCGKTTVAKIIGQIYQSMGILSPSGTFRVAYRDDFIAEYLGQTAIKTRKLLNSCIGGVLFVDEVYSLGPGQKDRDSFSKEAMDTLTSFLSEHKNDFCFIGAGYEEDVKRCFFAGNDGLERRFQWIHKIKKYTIEELSDIMMEMITEIKWQTCVDRKDIIKILKTEKNLFKNAGGDIETFLSKAKMVHAKRIFSLDDDHKFVLTKYDMVNAVTMVKKYRLDKNDIDDNKYLSMYN
jgi:SpoVK/Ycf46/Vps4 family AAA+-type ATPase